MNNKTDIRRSGGGAAKASKASIPIVQYYGLTIKRVGAVPLSHYYDEFIQSNIAKKVEVHDYHFELGKKHRLHIHGVISCPPNYDTKHLSRKGWRVHTVELDTMEDLYNWSNYIQKEYTYQTESQLKDIWDIQHTEYPFIHSN